MRSLQFNVLDYSTEELMDLTMLIFRETATLDNYGISITSLQPFVQAVSAKYRSGNPYHNFQHAVFVLWFSYMVLITETGVASNGSFFGVRFCEVRMCWSTSIN